MIPPILPWTTGQPVFCHICQSERVELIKEYSSFWRVTSDCQPWPRPGQLAFCHDCHTAQAPNTPAWLSEIDQIYKQYCIYSQSGGAEQPVFDIATGVAMARSERLVERLLSTLPLPRYGRLLDIGCGNGAFLRAFGRQMPDWIMMGTETNDKYRAQVESIIGVEAFHVGELATISGTSGTCQLISLIHVLEHIPKPGNFLQQVWERLHQGGTLLVQVPDYVSNPFELFIADHCTHFSLFTAEQLVAASNFEIVTATRDWIPKEISIVARKRASPLNVPSLRPQTDEKDSPFKEGSCEGIASPQVSPLAKGDSRGLAEPGFGPPPAPSLSRRGAQGPIVSQLRGAGEPLRFPGGCPEGKNPSTTDLAQLRSRVDWLGAVVSQARGLASNGAIGIFGTSIAASWVFGHCQPNVAFFVDEDKNRVGRRHLGCPVYHPTNAPKSCPVFVPLAPELSLSVVQRLAQTQLRFITPPPLPAC